MSSSLIRLAAAATLCSWLVGSALDARLLAAAPNAAVRPTEAFNGAAPEASVASSESNGGAKGHNGLFNRISPFGIGGEASHMLTRP
jgi:hypothetical protein